jgi:hypothetical protein
MPLSFGILLILCGLGIMGFGLFIFYAWLPLFYGLLGLEIGLLIGKWLTGDVGAVAIVLGVVGGLAAAASAYFLEPYRRLLLGYWGGALVALSLASLLGLERLGGVVGICLAVAGGIVGAMLTSKYFDLFVIAASAFGGATLVVAGLQVPLLIAGSSAGSLIPALLTLVLSLIGVSWQLNNAARWGHPMVRDPLADKTQRLQPK